MTPSGDAAAGKQSRRMSLIEAIANVLVGFGLALATQILVFPIFGLRASLSQNLALGFIFTLTSLARSYALRRLFEAIRIRSAAETRHSTSEDPCPAG
jgi:hypothetical protein